MIEIKLVKAKLINKNGDVIDTTETCRVMLDNQAAVHYRIEFLAVIEEFEYCHLVIPEWDIDRKLTNNGIIPNGGTIKFESGIFLELSETRSKISNLHYEIRELKEELGLLNDDHYLDE